MDSSLSQHKRESQLLEMSVCQCERLAIKSPEAVAQQKYTHCRSGLPHNAVHFPSYQVHSVLLVVYTRRGFIGGAGLRM